MFICKSKKQNPQSRDWVSEWSTDKNNMFYTLGTFLSCCKFSGVLYELICIRISHITYIIAISPQWNFHMTFWVYPLRPKTSLCLNQL